jgi:hypothetical protein
VWTLPAEADAVAATSVASFDEVLRGPSGRTLVISTNPQRLDGHSSARCLGTFPWSPRTPVIVT